MMNINIFLLVPLIIFSVIFLAAIGFMIANGNHGKFVQTLATILLAITVAPALLVISTIEFVFKKRI